MLRVGQYATHRRAVKDLIARAAPDGSNPLGGLWIGPERLPVAFPGANSYQQESNRLYPGTPHATTCWGSSPFQAVVCCCEAENCIHKAISTATLCKYTRFCLKELDPHNMLGIFSLLSGVDTARDSRLCSFIRRPGRFSAFAAYRASHRRPGFVSGTISYWDSSGVVVMAADFVGSTNDRVRADQAAGLRQAPDGLEVERFFSQEGVCPSRFRRKARPEFDDSPGIWTSRPS